MKKIIITGAYSLLGLGLIKTMPLKQYKLYFGIHKQSYAIDTITQTHIDMLNKKNISQVFSKIQPDIVIHAAALSNIDYCEKNKKEASAININGLKNIIENCHRNKTKIIFISSNAVFDGINTPKHGYSEKDKPRPINFYGQTKYQGELLIKQSGLPYLITRLITMYGWQPTHARENPVTWKLQQLEKNEKLFMVTDRFINPLYNINAAETIWALIKKNKQGIFHLAGKNKVSRYEWALEVSKIFGYPTSLILPVKSDYFQNITTRPVNTNLNTSKIEKNLGIKPLSLKNGLLQMKNELSHFPRAVR